MRKLILACAFILPTASSVGDAYSNAQYASLHFTDTEAELRYHLKKNFLNPNWIRVAKLESSQTFDSYIAREANNYVGMHTVRRRQTTAIGSVSFYASYATLAESITDLRYWAELNPQRPGERFEDWLRRRHWNPNPAYYTYLRTIQ